MYEEKLKQGNFVMTNFWKNRRVMITGHTGFKGSWLVQLLNQLGAEVFGYALKPDTQPALFIEANLSKFCRHTIANIQDITRLQKLVHSAQPEVVFHLAAQPLVLHSYQEPLETWKTNLLGTANLLESLRQIKHLCVAIIVTTDKVYENREWNYAYRETDRLGGYDPYSSSKAAVELAVASWRKSFLSSPISKVRLASARAGNVIGGGDWSKDRIVPDMVRHLVAEKLIPVRNPNAIRPWQHVLEPLAGYLRLAEWVYNSDHPKLQSAFNFGPDIESCRTVKDLVEEGLKHWSGQWDKGALEVSPHEAELLKLSTDKVHSLIKWTPRWNFEKAVWKTFEWYYRHHQGESAIELMQEQINDYQTR